MPSEYGIELDLRYEGRNLILHHDPFVREELFEELFKRVSSSTSNFEFENRRYISRSAPYMRKEKMLSFVVAN